MIIRECNITLMRYGGLLTFNLILSHTKIYFKPYLRAVVIYYKGSVSISVTLIFQYNRKNDLNFKSFEFHNPGHLET